MDNPEENLPHSVQPVLQHRTTFARRTARILATLLVLVATAYGAGVWYVQRAGGKVAKPQSTSMSAFTVTKGENFFGIGSALASKNLVTSAVAFDSYAFFTGRSHGLESGEYVLSPSMSVSQIVALLSGGKVIDQYEAVRIRDGSTVAQLGAQLQSQGLGTAADFQAQAGAAAQTYTYLGEHPSTKSLEGYLFPDTYFVSQQNAGQDTIDKALSNFSAKVTPLMPQVAASGMSLHDVVTLASIVEKEVSTDADRKVVAGIFLKRLSIGMPLESNATLGYVLGGDTSMLSAHDEATDSPYNDYTHKGLPPTPIGNPSLSSIEAVLNPTESGYLYFIAAPGGTVVYAATLQQQDANIQKYLR